MRYLAPESVNGWPTHKVHDAIRIMARQRNFSVPTEEQLRWFIAVRTSKVPFYIQVERWLVDLERKDAVERDPPIHRPNVDRSGFVYFLRGADLIKIGSARDVDRRIRDIQFMCPVRLELLLAIPGSAELERLIHKHHAKLRAHGEWFRAEPPLTDHIDRLRRRFP